MFKQIKSLLGITERNGLRAMTLEDLPQVCRIIAQTDEDDAAQAQATMRESNCEGMYVLINDGNIIGVIGAKIAQDVDDIAWLSWTYLSSQHRGFGFGQYMMNQLLEKLDAYNVRKLFIMSSDYSENGHALYAKAHDFYRAAGATLELTVEHYHSADEAMLIFGLPNERIKKTPAARPPKPTGVEFTELCPASEAEDGYALNWTVNGSEITHLDQLMVQARAESARVVLTSMPEDVAQCAQPALTDAGFIKVGSLHDYYDTGFDQIWWRANLEQSEPHSEL